MNLLTLFYHFRMLSNTVSNIKFNQLGSDNRKKCKQKIKELSRKISESRITEDELKYINNNYRYRGKIETDSPVYTIGGKTQILELEQYTNISADKETIKKKYYIDCFEILWIPEFIKSFNDYLFARVVFTTKGQAIVLSMAENFSIDEKIQEIKKAQQNVNELERDMSKNEFESLFKGNKKAAIICLFISLFLIGISPSLAIISSPLLLIAAINIFSIINKKKKSYIYKVKERLTLDEYTGEYRVGPFKLYSQWSLGALINDIIEVEGASKSIEKHGLIALKVNNKFSIKYMEFKTNKLAVSLTVLISIFYIFRFIVS